MTANNEIVPFDKNKLDELKIVSDFNFARDNMKDAIEKGVELADIAIEIAKLQDNPKAFEVAGRLLETVVKSNKEFLELQHKLKMIKSEAKNTNSDSKDGGSINVDKAIFVGTTDELKKRIRNEVLQQQSNNDGTTE